MITEAIWTQNHHIKGSSRGAIRNWILDKYTDVDENRIKTHLSSNLSKMLEDDREDHYPCLIRVDNMNYKLTPEWRKEWTKTYNKKKRQTKRKKRPSDHLNIHVMLISFMLPKSVKDDKMNIRINLLGT